MVWGCFAGDIVSDLFRIQGTLNQHGYHSIQHSAFKTAGKALQVKVVERTQRVSKAVIKAKGGYFEKNKI